MDEPRRKYETDREERTREITPEELYKSGPEFVGTAVTAGQHHNEHWDNIRMRTGNAEETSW